MNIMTYFEKLVEDLSSKPYHIVSKRPTVFYLISKEDGILSGIHEVEMFLNLFDMNINFRKHKENGQTMKRGDIICSFQGEEDSLYHALDVVKFLLGKMSGIASMVHYYQGKLGQARIGDLGLYTPGYEALEAVAFKDGGAEKLSYYLVDETMVDLSASLKDAIDKAKFVHSGIIALEVTDITKFYEAMDTNADVLIIKYFNDEAIRRAILDNRGQKILIVGGLILPNRLDIISSYQFDYLYSTLFNQAARIYDFALKVGN
jgi:nicotinate-nucleotide pyrophosphorylase (carboxylating)